MGTVGRILKQFEATGDVGSTSRHQERRHLRALDDTHELFIIGLVLEQPTLQLKEICYKIENTTSVKVSPSTICRLLHRYGMTLKKVRVVAAQRSADLRGHFMAEMMFFRRKTLVWLDETGSDRRNFLRKYGYSIRGDRAVETCFVSRGERINAIAAISCDGVVAYQLLKETVNTDNFFDFIRGHLLSELQEYDGESSSSVLILDNLSVHHAEPIVSLLQDTGILVEFLPPYSPDLNPIEEVFSYVKYYLRQHSDMIDAITDPTIIIHAAFNSITRQDCQAWITHSGYSY